MAKPTTFNRTPFLKEGVPYGRARFVLGMLFMGSLALASRTTYLQVFDKSFLQHQGEIRYARNLQVPAMRGWILDRYERPLAGSAPVKAIGLLPGLAELTTEQRGELARILSLDASLISKLADSNKSFVYLKREVPPDVAHEVKNLKIEGVQVFDDYKRYYPEGELAAHVVGFADIDENGQEGIELSKQAELQGENGIRHVIKNRRGQVISEAEVRKEPRNGKNIVLSIDARIQHVTSVALSEAIEKTRSKAGAAIVLNAKTGEILALVNQPTYNPNARSSVPIENRRNRAIVDTYEPGSTMKPFIAGMALESKKFKATSLINTRGGSMTISGKTINDAHPHGVLSVSQVIQKSSNVGTAQLALSFSPEHMWALYDKLGFGKKLGMGFPGEAKGVMRKAGSWKPIEQATMSYGHGISVSLMHLAHAYTVFAGDGEIMPLTLLKANEQPVGEKVFSPQVTKELRDMLESVVTKEGTAPQAAVPGYRVGGKTGTAHKIEGGRYVNKYVGSFVGLAPMSDPRLVVAVMLDEPRGAYYGGVIAGPVFSKIMGSALHTLSVPMDAPIPEGKAPNQQK